MSWTAALNAGIPKGATEMKLITAPAVSADGRLMTFEWIDDIWTASTDGGEAVRVVENPARDAFPRFTPDARRIVFSSDRTGSMQVFSIPLTGGETIQHTHQSEGNELECLSPDGTHALVRGNRELSGSRATLLLVVNLTKDEREQRLFDAPVGVGAAWSPDGKRVLFCTGGELLYRKGYRGSRASQVWDFEISSRKFKQLTTGDTETRNPIWHADGQGFDFLSAANGTLNLWSRRFEDAAASPVTTFTGDGVFMRQPAADRSTYVFQHGSELLRFRPKQDPVPEPLVLWTQEKLPDRRHSKVKIATTVEADFPADLQQSVFAAGGELWATSPAGQRSIRLTDTPAVESEVHFSANGEWLYFLRDDGLDAQVLRARFHDGRISNEQQITRGPRSKCRITPSPDGSCIAWIEGTGDVFTARADGSDPVRVFPCWNVPSLDWSPDGKWLTLAAEDANANRDIWLVAADGKREPVNATCHPAFEGSPRWSPDGRRIVFSSANRDAGGKSQLWQMDFGTNGLTASTSDTEIREIGDRARRISTGEIEPMRVLWAADSKSLWFQNRKSTDPNLYAVDITTAEIKTVATTRGVPIRMAADGSLLWRVNQLPAVLKPTGNTLFPISISLERNRTEMMKSAYHWIWRTLGERFYDPEMNGTDWNAIRTKYEFAAAECRTSRQFDRVISQLVGELNASHLSFLRMAWPEETAKTLREEPDACSGILFQDGEPEGPMVVKSVIHGTPVSLLPNPPQPGEIITRIAGQPITNRTPLHRFLNGAAGKPLAIILKSKDGKEREVLCQPVTFNRARALDRQNQELAARKTVREAGNVSYLSVRDMSLEAFNQLELAVYREPPASEGLILDLRNNGGGREADRMLSLFCQPQHSFTIPRDGPRGYPEARLVHSAWHKPLVVLCNENTFSNAEIFCHAMGESKRAPLVGVATAGGVSSAEKTRIPEAGELQIPFRGWFQLKSGRNLDLHAAEPDYLVALTPADIDAGRDPQLEKAIFVLQGLIKPPPAEKTSEPAAIR